MRSLWRHAWPAFVIAGAILLVLGLVVLGGLPALRDSRLDTFAAAWGTAALAVFALPLLLAWPIWLVFGLHSRAARLRLYLALMLADLAGCVWVFVSVGHIQM